MMRRENISSVACQQAIGSKGRPTTKFDEFYLVAWNTKPLFKISKMRASADVDKWGIRTELIIILGSHKYSVLLHSIIWDLNYFEIQFIFCNVYPGTIKGQLISKYLFGIFNSSKKRTKKFDLTTMVVVPQVELFSFLFLEEFEDTKNTFRN